MMLCIYWEVLTSTLRASNFYAGNSLKFYMEIVAVITLRIDDFTESELGRQHIEILYEMNSYQHWVLLKEWNMTVLRTATHWIWHGKSSIHYTAKSMRFMESD